MNLDKNFYQFHERIKSILEKEFFKKKIIEQKKKNLLLFTEFEKYKKRIQKEKFDLFKLANQEVIIELISVLDDFKRCLLKNEVKNNKNLDLMRGINLIYEKFFSILKKKGIELIITNKGDNFSTDLHEALSQIPTISQNFKGKIIDIVEIGYLLHDKVIRHAKVIVGK